MKYLIYSPWYLLRVSDRITYLQACSRDKCRVCQGVALALARPIECPDIPIVFPLETHVDLVVPNINRLGVDQIVVLAIARSVDWNLFASAADCLAIQTPANCQEYSCLAAHIVAKYDNQTALIYRRQVKRVGAVVRTKVVQ